MNRTWIYRAASAAVLAGGLLLLGSGTANAGVPIAGTDAPAATTTSPGLARPIIAPRDPAAEQPGTLGTGQQVTGVATRILPLRTGSGAVFNESATTAEGLPGVSAPSDGMPSGNNTQVNVPQLAQHAGDLVAPVQQLAGPAVRPLASVTGPVTGGEAAIMPIPLAAPTQVLPLTTGTEAGGFTVGQNTQLPTGPLLNTVSTSTGSALGQLSGSSPAGSLLPGTASTMPAPVQARTLPAPTGESATESTLSNLASGTNVASLPIGPLTDPVTSQVSTDGLTNGGPLSGGALTPERAPSAPAATTDGQPATDGQATTDGVPAPVDPAQGAPANGGLPVSGALSGGNPLSAVTNVLGGLPIGG